MTRARHLRRPPNRQRGAALLVVLVTVALVTALAMDLAYQARVGLQIAANGRDELVALAGARGAINLSRLVLHFQAQLDDQASSAAGLAGQLGGANPLGGAPAGPSGLPRIQIWKLVPVDSGLASNLFGDRARPAEAAAGAGNGASAGARAGGAAPGAEVAAGEAGPGAKPGGFSAMIDDEDRKVNAQLDGLTGLGGLLGGQLAAFQALVADRRWDPLFEREDAGGVKQSRAELAANLIDWVDDDKQQSVVTGLPDRPVDKGFGDENYLYDRGPDRYKAKNARFDSLQELFMVAGFSDLHMAAFGDRLTVYPGRDAKMNINADTPGELVRNARIMADTPLQPAFSDPTFPDRLAEAVKLVRGGGFLTMTSQQFASVLVALKVSIRPEYLDPRNIDKRGAFTDRSYVFRIRGQGSTGAVVKNVEAVVSFEPSQAREDARVLGRLLHWSEE